jgi:hypothetical protein
LDANCAYAHYLLAGAYSDPDDPTFTNKYEAFSHAEKAVRLTNSKNAVYLMGLSRAFRVARKSDEAVQTARMAVELNPCEEYQHELNKLEEERFKPKF